MHHLFKCALSSVTCSGDYLSIGPFHIRKRMCVIYEYAIIEFDVTFGFHRGSQKSSKCIGVNGGTPKIRALAMQSTYSNLANTVKN